MMELQNFHFDGSAIRVQSLNGEPWFVAKDVSDILGYRTSNDMTRRLDADERGTQKVRTPSGDQEMTVINESGLYSAILGSNKPEVKRFKKWVTGEVLPAIRKTGGYINANENMSDAEIMSKALMIAQKTIDQKNSLIEEQQRVIEEAQPKVAFVETFATSRGNILIRDFAKMISQALNVKFGQNELFAWLKENGWMNSNRYPSFKSNERGLMHVTEGFHCLSDGATELHHTTKITPKGQTFFFGILSEYFKKTRNQREELF